MIAVIDYRIGNLHNLKNALDVIDAPAKIVFNPKELAQASKILIPGVGAFKAAMRNFIDYGFAEEIVAATRRGIPIFGVCVGMQILFSLGLEDGKTPGLGLINGVIKKFTKPFKIPHMGWNQVNFVQRHPLFEGINNNSWFYFLHSYFAQTPTQNVLATTDYHEVFCSVAVHNNICGAQFHPEKSQADGLKILSNFCFNFN